MRLFVGIPLATAVMDELSTISVRLQSSTDGLRWSAPESWHITLQFLGNTGQEQYECIVARLGELRLPAVPIQFEGLGFFERAGVFFAGVGRTPGLLSLQQRVTATTSRCGSIPETVFPVVLHRQGPRTPLSLRKAARSSPTPPGSTGIPGTRPYHPHVTLARSKSKGRAAGLEGLKSKIHRQPEFTGFVAEEFFLYESVTGGTGVRYEILERFKLDRPHPET
jgi:2'-5' RNA ligase